MLVLRLFAFIVVVTLVVVPIRGSQLSEVSKELGKDGFRALVDSPGQG